MTDRISNQVRQLSFEQSVRANQQQTPKQSFGELLEKEQNKVPQEPVVAFSKHAISRAEERGIEITPNLIDQLRGSMIRAQAKGATNILALDTEKAFIINVPNAKVITAITQEEMKENIFTNIDGAVFL